MRDIPVHARLNWSGDLARVDLGDLGAFRVTPSAIEIARRCADNDHWREVLFGPAALMWLAERSVFALHASAFAVEEEACALLGVSGAGKSTLARHAASHGMRIADDVLPIAIRGDRIVARTPFPQLKLADSEQYHGRSLPLARIALLRRGESLQVKTAAPGDVGRWILRHTLGSRLYSPNAMVAHLQMASLVAAAVERGELRAQVLTVPHRPEDPAAAAKEAYAALAAS